MAPVQPTTTISIDDAVFEVANLSPEIQQMVAYLDDWRQKEADATSELLMARGALRDLQNTLLQAIQKAQADASSDGGEAPPSGDEPAATDTPAA